jgi:hypothetical protein
MKATGPGTILLALGLFIPGPWTSAEAVSQKFELRFRGDFNIPTGAPLEHIGPAAGFGGISGINYDPKTRTLLAVSDARESCRFYRLEPIIKDEGFEVRPVGVTLLLGADGARLAHRSMDPESLAIAAGGDVFISSEGDTGAGAPPGVYVFDSKGRLKKTLSIPDKFLPGRSGGPKGTRGNLAFESLALSPDGTRLFVGTEEALLQDGEETSPEAGTSARIIEYIIEGEEIRAAREFAYPVGPVAKPDELGPGVGGNGLVELVALDHHRLLTMERSFFVEGSSLAGPRTHQQIQIFWMSLEQASDVSHIDSLRGVVDFRPAQKTLILDLDDIVPLLEPEFPSLDNFEGMCFGPELPNGNRTLILVSDNNFKQRQRTAFFLFELIEN